MSDIGYKIVLAEKQTSVGEISWRKTEGNAIYPLDAISNPKTSYLNC